MYLLKIKQSICIIGVLLVSFLSQAQGNENANNIYVQWQTSNCGINEDIVLIRSLVENVSILEPLLFNGFREGPTPEYVERTASSELNRMRLNQKLISEGKFETGLSKEDLQIAAEMNLDSAKEGIEKGIIEGWKTRALTGLSYLNTDKSNTLLETLAKDQSSPFNALAIFLLTQNGTK